MKFSQRLDRRARRSRRPLGSAGGATLLSWVFVAALLAGQGTQGQSPPPPVVTGSPLTVAVLPPLRASGRFFLDPAGGVVILRGVNLTGNAKVPPFDPGVGTVELDRIRGLGMNVIRLLFLWEAYEKTPGVYNEAYLAMIRGVAAAASDRGIYTIVDIHQDGFSRYASRGSGDGFPSWAVSGRLSVPDNGPHSRYWPALMATDPTTYHSFNDFYANVAGVRTRYLILLDRVAAAFATIPGVIGYDPINEPWGDERRDLGPLYQDVATVVRARHPAAILFVEGHITTNTGLQTKLDRPAFDNFAYAPHYYKPTTIALRRWQGSTWAIDHAFATMDSKSREWDCPLIVAEFGAGATFDHAGEYVDALVDRLDALWASGAQWNYTPLWNPRDKDGWNAEDFNILDPWGCPRPNFRIRPHPRRVAGTPLSFATGGSGVVPPGQAFEFTWQHRPELGDTEIFIPGSLFPPGGFEVLATPGITWLHDPPRQSLVCHALSPGTYRVRVTTRR